MYSIPDLYKGLFNAENRILDAKVVINGIDYTGAEIVEFEIDDSICSGENLEVGSAISSVLTCTIRTADIIAKNAKVQPYIRLGLDIEWMNANVEWMNANFNWEGEYSEWMPLGEFYIESRKFSEGTWKFTCYDKLMMANQAYETTLEFPATMDAVLNDVCAQLGISRDSSLQINSGYMIPFNYDYTISEVIRYIAASHAACAKITKEGKLGFVKFNKNDAALESITPADYSNLSHDGEVKTITRIVVTYNDDGEYLEVGIGDESETLRFYNPFVTEAMLNTIFADLNGYSYKPYDMQWRCYPYLETGDRINVGYFETPAPVWEDVPIPWNDANFNWEGTGTFSTVILNSKIVFGGGLSGKLSAQAAAEQQTEFKGTLTRKVENLSKTTIKEDKPYYGVSIGRANGLNIKKSDGSSEVILNSDQLTFKANGEDKLYFDPVSGKYKFKGTLEAVDGVFSGTVYAENINTSHAKITTAQIENLEVGTNVAMGANATISWGTQVTDKPFIPQSAADLGALTGSQLTTILGYDYVVTGRIYASQLNGGVANLAESVNIGDLSSTGSKALYFRTNGAYGASVKMSTSGWLDVNSSYGASLRGSASYMECGNAMTLYANNGINFFSSNVTFDSNSPVSFNNDVSFNNNWVYFNNVAMFNNGCEVSFNSGTTVGFFGATPIGRKTATKLSANATLSDVITKVNGILGILGQDNFGLISVS